MTASHSACIHHWIIDSNEVGRCKNCGTVRDFLQGKPQLTKKEITKVSGFRVIRGSSNHRSSGMWNGVWDNMVRIIEDGSLR